MIEDEAGEVVAVEVKAGSTYRREDLRGLIHLRDKLGDRFLGGVQLDTGQRSGAVDDRVALVPVDALWHS